MPYNFTLNDWELTDRMTRNISEKKSANELQERKHSDWDENYLLYRNKVKTNRLTQRQAVNIPLMKETVKTLLSSIDEPPEVEWKELSGDDQKELILEEVWQDTVKKNKLELIDMLDKKNVLLYGFSARKLNIIEDGISISVLDPYDISFDPLMVPWSLESARYIVLNNIFKSVQEILADDKYTDEGKEEIKIWVNSPAGMQQSKENKEVWEKKMERLKTMGVDHADFPLFAGGDTIVNLTEHYTKVWDTKTKKFIKRVYVYADNKINLSDKTLDECIGVDFWPFIVWSEDVETNDIYPDAVADLVRVPNKVLNIWFSQMIENRTLTNFQMHWYSPIQGYSPQTYTPGPGVMLPAPPGDDINKVIKPVEINGLDDTFAAIQVLTNIVERGTGATGIEKGQGEEGQQTLGEVQILIGKATERTTAMTKFYRMALYELAWKWNRMMHANAPKMLKLYKIGRNGKSFPKTVLKGDWVSTAGYEPTVASSSEQEANDLKTLQKWGYVTSRHPNNIALQNLSLKRELKLLDTTPEELREVEEGEKAQAIPEQAGQDQVNPELLDEVQGRVNALELP